jgi:hypothetical protein
MLTPAAPLLNKPIAPLDSLNRKTSAPDRSFAD